MEKTELEKLRYRIGYIKLNLSYIENEVKKKKLKTLLLAIIMENFLDYESEIKLTMADIKKDYKKALLKLKGEDK